MKTTRNVRTTGRWYSKRKRLLALIAVVAVVGLIGVFLFVRSAPTDLAGERPTPVPSVSAAPALEPRGTLYADATFNDWTIATAPGSTTRFRADKDEAFEGASSLRIDSTDTALGEQSGLSQTISAEPNTVYLFSAWSQSTDTRVVSDPVQFVMGPGGDQRIDFPSVTGDWAESTWSYTTSDNETSLEVSIRPSGPVSEFRLDNLVVSVEGETDGLASTANSILNASFESYTSPSRLSNASLVMETGSAALTVDWLTSSVDWAVSDDAGTGVASGTIPVAGGSGSVDLAGLAQGYYSASVAESGHPESTITAAFIILDAAQPGQPSSDSRIGVGTHIEQQYYGGSEVAAESLGFTGTRTDAYWSQVELTSNVMSFPSLYDSAFPSFKSANVPILPISNGGNPLHDGGAVPTSADGLAAYGSYTRQLVERYSLPAVEIFNELNTQRFNNSACGVGAECYLPLLRSAAEAVKSTSPSTLIVGPANGNQDDPFLTELYALGGLNYLDVVSYHPYVAEPEALIGDIQQARARIREYNNGQDKPLWLTEFGWTATGNVTEELQANYLVRAETIILANGVEKLYWYDLVNDSVEPTHEGAFGLFLRSTETVAAFAPKPAAMAQGLLIRKIAGKDFVAADAFNGAFSYQFGSGNTATRVAWATADTTVSYVADDTVTVTNAMGRVTQLQPVNGVVSVNLTGQPVYVEGVSEAVPS